jgi:hypothetical protein
MSHPFTPEYIRMAKAAEEIQAMRPDTESYGNSDFVSGEGEIDVFAHAAEYWVEPIGAWYPRLDQLLGMLGDPIRFYTIITDTNPHVPPGPPDWHELAMVVVMERKFGKRWDEKEWVKA